MPQKSKKHRKIVATDINDWAARIVEASTGQRMPVDLVEREKALIAAEKAAKKNPAAVALGRLGGLKGGKARAEALSPAKRSEIARKAAKGRWDQKRRAEIQELVKHRFTAKEIAAKLGISVESVQAAKKQTTAKASQPLAI